MKSIPWVNFNNIFWAAFLYNSVFEAFLCLHIVFVIFCLKNIGPNAAHKMFVKLTTGVNLNNLFLVAFCMKVFRSLDLNESFDAIYVLLST